jgi:uncharacterized protein YneF (UPF0154 family)
MNNQKPANSISQLSQNAVKKTRNLANQASKTYQESSPMGKIIFFIIVVLFIVFIVYVIYVAVKASQKASADSPIIVNDVIDAYVARPGFALPQVTQGMNQSFSTWIYIKDWNYKFGQYKNILWNGNPGNTSTTPTNTTAGNIHSPSMWLYPLTNSLKVMTSTSAPQGVESCDIQNIPLMTWVHITYVLNNRTVDIYVNGKLERSCALQGIPILNNGNVFMTTGNPLAGFYGKVGKTQYFTKALLPNDVMNLYQQGPLGTAQYQVNFFTNGQFVSITSADSIANSS